MGVRDRQVVICMPGRVLRIIQQVWACLRTQIKEPPLDMGQVGVKNLILHDLFSYIYDQLSILSLGS